MEFAIKALVLGLAGATVWALWRAGQRSIFVVKIVRGTPKSRVGTVTRAFLAEVGEIAALHGITHGRISGLVEGVHIRLVFSSEFPRAAQQQLRNWWGVHGWRAGKLLRPRPNHNRS